ncbi:fungal-specific transcription factor domain-containing protein [Aspergillus karnatakaensis]|uniref:Zn(II)2Cys6 transcription factor n=1 Tax=Aspergillus karnatakaensis TaxID=1810916 RepID=UPI003CCD6FA1
MPKKSTGCWTCRARRKKCDGARPVCSTCRLRSITCYGYDEVKPEWMDGSTSRQTVLQGFKRQCKLAYSQRRSEQAKSRSKLSRQLQSHAPVQPRPSDQPVIEVTSNSPVVDSVPFTERELDLVMYYLDHIFPRLCTFFKYNPTDDGRGWLLSLFLRTKPLCALAVCLSACDRAQLVLGALNETSQPLHDLEMQHIQIATDLRDHLGRLVDEDGAYQMSAAVEALACIMHLIFFELWIPRKNDMENDWVLHLNAASTLLNSVARKLDYDRPSNVNNRIEDHFPTESLTGSELATFNYYYSHYTYFLTSMAASIGLTPQSSLSLDRTHAIFHRQQSKLRDTMGCEDWVMTTVLEIASLREWKAHMKENGSLSLRELTQRAGHFETRLTAGLADLLARRRSPGKDSREQQQDMVTDIFINGALVFLHGVTSGLYPNLQEIQDSVLQTLIALEYMRQHSKINVPSWPYCIAGCLALEGLHDRFRALYPLPQDGSHPLVNTKWSLDIMEESWRLRCSQPPDSEIYDCGTMMAKLGTRILLS